MRRLSVLAIALALLVSAFPARADDSDAALAAQVDEINAELAAMGLEIAVEAIDFFTVGEGRPSFRRLQQPFRWVPNDPRRLAQGIDITYLVDQSDGNTASGLTSAQTEAAVDRAMDTWQADSCLRKVDLVKRADSGADPDIFDFLVRPRGTFGVSGNPFLADITNAGWLPRAFFEAVGGPGGGRGILAFSVTFIFVSGGVPTDINGDNYLDTALNEVYYNDNFGNPTGDRASRPWGIDVGFPGFDVETVALHENGHSLGIGHFGPPPAALMNPRYTGINQEPDPTDQAAMCTVWASWPNP